MYKSRYIEEKIRLAARNFKVVLVVGARQVGKTTVLRALFPTIPMVTFNPIQDVQGARKDPAFFLSTFKGPVIFDEIQFAPELLAFIKLKVDESHAKGQYFLTGSQNLSMLKTVAESMAGRVAVIDLGPMILEELTASFSFKDGSVTPPHWLEHYLNDPQTLLDHCAQPAPDTFLLDALFRGGYPGLIGMDDAMLPMYFDGYLKTYVDRDVRTMTDIDQLVKFESFVTILAALTSQEINYTQLGREIDSAGKTTQRWLGILQATYMWRDVEAFSFNSIKQVTQRRKGYFVDTGFACQLLKIKSPEQLRGHPQCGALFETYVNNAVYAVVKSLLFGVHMYHWRSTGGAEVDMVLAYGNALYPIEIKMKSNVSLYEARGIKAFQEAYKDSSYTVMPGIIVCASQTAYWLNERVMVLPWNMVCKS